MKLIEHQKGPQGQEQELSRRVNIRHVRNRGYVDGKLTFLPKGGFTVVSVDNYLSIAYCHPNDYYCKRTGISEALNKLYKKANSIELTNNLIEVTL